MPASNQRSPVVEEILRLRPRLITSLSAAPAYCSETDGPWWLDDHALKAVFSYRYAEGDFDDETLTALQSIGLRCVLRLLAIEEDVPEGLRDEFLTLAPHLTSSEPRGRFTMKKVQYDLEYLGFRFLAGAEACPQDPLTIALGEAIDPETLTCFNPYNARDTREGGSELKY